MDAAELFRFNKADKVVHNVEDEWHYPIMTKAGFKATTLTGIGFVRSYHYEHPSGYKMRVATGVNADYWNDMITNDIGYCGALEGHLQRLNLK